MLKDIKVWDKIVYDWYETKNFILVEKIEDVEFSIPQEDGTTKPSGELSTMINDKYSIRWPLRKPSKIELEKEKFIWLTK